MGFRTLTPSARHPFIYPLGAPSLTLIQETGCKCPGDNCPVTIGYMTGGKFLGGMLPMEESAW